MSTHWDHSVDLLIAGSGGGGMVAGLAALDSGIEPLIIEKQGLVGGSTGLSGGMVWLPNNPLMRADGIPDSHEDGLAYFDDVVGDIGMASSPARREMFLTAGYEMINFLVRKGVRFVRCPGWSDYYPNHKGGNEARPRHRRRTLRCCRAGKTGATRFSPRWPRATGSSSRRTSYVRSSTSTARRRPSRWRRGLLAHRGRPAPATRDAHQRRVTHRPAA